MAGLTQFYTRRWGKYTVMKEMIGNWCMKAKKGARILIATPMGTYILRFEGKYKPKPSEIKFVLEGDD